MGAESRRTGSGKAAGRHTQVAEVEAVHVPACIAYLSIMLIPGFAAGRNMLV